MSDGSGDVSAPHPARPRRRLGLLDYEDLPPWMKAVNNRHIRTGYRPETVSFADCLRSVASLHNESVNIWTHLAGSFAFVILLARLALLNSAADPLSVTWLDTTAFACFYVGGAVCLGGSALFHTCACHRHAALPLNRLDYCGIAVLIWGSFVPAIRTAFFCYPLTAGFFVGLVTVLSLAAIYMVLTPNGHSHDFRRRRTWTFIGLGLSAVLPVGYACAKFGVKDASIRMSLPWLVSSGALYIAGAILYAEQCPEAFCKPGRCDIVGASHQLFHVAILMAAFCHYVAISRSHNVTHHILKGLCLPGTVTELLGSVHGQ